MFSRGLRCFAAAVGCIGSAALVHAGPDGPGNGAAPHKYLAQYVTSAEHSELARAHRLIDRNEIDSMPELVDSLLDTIVRLSSYAKPADRPAVHKVSRAEIESTICRGPCAVKAWHMPGEGIFLDDSLTPESDLVDRSILLHELVHFLQELNGEGTPADECARWLHREREAYELQNQYLALVGTGSYHMMVANQSWIVSTRNTCETRPGVNTAR
jgi:hypothetical protein